MLSRILGSKEMAEHFRRLADQFEKGTERVHSDNGYSSMGWLPVIGLRVAMIGPPNGRAQQTEEARLAPGSSNFQTRVLVLVLHRG
jgi:hypothetical protein